MTTKIQKLYTVQYTAVSKVGSFTYWFLKLLFTLKLRIISSEKQSLWKIVLSQEFHYIFYKHSRIARAFASLYSRADCTPVVVFFHDKSKHTWVQLEEPNQRSIRELHLSREYLKVSNFRRKGWHHWISNKISKAFKWIHSRWSTVTAILGCWYLRVNIQLLTKGSTIYKEPQNTILVLFNYTSNHNMLVLRGWIYNCFRVLPTQSQRPKCLNKSCSWL